jgi:hypothetical protein
VEKPTAVVGQQVGHGQLAADGGDVDDAARAAGAHPRQDRQGWVERAPEVGGHDPLEIRVGEIGHRGDDDDAAVVDQNVDLPIVTRDRVDHGRDLGAVGDVARDGQHRRAS